MDPRVPGSFLDRRGSWCWSGRMGKGADVVPGGHDRSCPGPGGGDIESARAAAACQAAVCAEEAARWMTAIT
jgi:hypothetical protein